MRAGGVAAILLLMASASSAAHADVTVIAGPGRDSAALDRGQLRALFTMRVRQWPDGTPVQVFVLPDSNSIHDRFCREVLGTYPYVLRNTWDRAVFTGTGRAPERVSSQNEMLEKVRRTHGAIGYIDRPSGPSAQRLPAGLTTVFGGDSP